MLQYIYRPHCMKSKDQKSEIRNVFTVADRKPEIKTLSAVAEHKPRVLSFDLARGFTVFFIPAIHCAMLYSRPGTYDTPLMFFLRFIAEGPGGQLLMCLMGIAATFKAVQPLRTILGRSLLLLGAGTLLNVAKFVIPFSLDGLPSEVIEALQLKGSTTADTIWHLCSLGDILHFAALTHIFLWLVMRSKAKTAFAVAVGTLATLISSKLILSQPVLSHIPYALKLFIGHPPRVFFPVFPWLLYPMVGLILGLAYQRDAENTMMLSALIGGICLVNGLLLDFTFPAVNPYGFYQTAPAATVWHLGIVLVTVSFWHWVSVVVKQNIFFRFLQFSAKNITLIYLIQWVLICWALPWTGYQKLKLTHSVILMVIVTLNTYLLTYLFQLIKQHYVPQKNL